MQHVAIERLYYLVMCAVDLTEAEYLHLMRCTFCVDWLDASVKEKIFALRLKRCRP
jgi:hypothetical protein